MTYRQDGVPRSCAICREPIEMGRWMIDLFRQSTNKAVEWVHEDCARRAIETWLDRKRGQNDGKAQN